MKNLYPSRWAAPLLLLITFSHCKKDTDSGNCGEILQVKISGAKTSYYPGDTIQLSTSMTPQAQYSWTTATDHKLVSSTNYIHINSCSKSNAGWYYLAVSNHDCASHVDSVLISVVNKPVPPPCSPANNAVTFSSIPSVPFKSVAYGTDPTRGFKDLSGNPGPGYPNLDIYFNPSWNSKEPEDGVYTLSKDIIFTGADPYSVFITSHFTGMSFEASPGNVYVTHTEDGKLQVTFCGLDFSAEFAGQTYTQTASGKLTAP